MKKNLNQLTVSQFVDLICGNTKVLLRKGEVVSPKKIATTVRNIVFEYKEIADTAGVRSYIANAGNTLKARMAISLYSICKNMVVLNQYDLVREVLESAGIRSARHLNDNRVAAEVTSRLERAKSDLEKLIAEQQIEAIPEESRIRADFDGQTAALMAYFKFQIDPDAMKATVYAHLVARHNREIKAQLAVANKK